MSKHSDIVGGSSAKRVINCPGSVALTARMPNLSSSYANEGSLLHNAAARCLETTCEPEDCLGMTFEGIELTQGLIDNKLIPAFDLLAEYDPKIELDFMVETEVSFGDFLPGVFGSADVVGRMGDKAVVLDWKFGDGVMVDAEENYQGLFYAAAAMRTPECAWAFDGVDEVEIVIIQPPHLRTWTTTVARVKEFERALVKAVKAAAKPNAKLAEGEWCQFCDAKTVCPLKTGAVARVQRAALEAVNVEDIGRWLAAKEDINAFFTQVEALAFELLEQGLDVHGYKLVPKRALRKWTDEGKAKTALLALGLNEPDVTETKLLSPAQAEKVLKKHKLALPEDVVVAVSSGSTIAPESDPRPAVMQIGKQLSAALGKLV